MKGYVKFLEKKIPYPVPLQKIYHYKKHYCLWLALFAGNGATSSIENIFFLGGGGGVNFGFIAALIIVSI